MAETPMRHATIYSWHPLPDSRDGAADSYNSAMRLIGVELYWYADA